MSIQKPSKTSNAPGENANILNDYRSVTYNVTLAALPREGLSKPETYRQGGLKYVIAASKGKNNQGISNNITAQSQSAPVRKTANANFIGSPSQTFDDGSARIVDDDGNVLTIDKDGKTSVTAAPPTLPSATSTSRTPAATPPQPINAKGAIEGFNKKSGGALDLYIDGLEIESLMTPNPKTGPSLATTIKFEIYEPYSANGFIEALFAASLAAGWPNYLVACYVLKIEFYGYPDNINNPVAEPVLIDATRYIPIRITGSEMDISEQGTKYRVSAIAYNEIAFSTPNKISTDISMQGTDVYEVLKNFFTSLNKSIQESVAKETSGRTTSFNEYEIYFPKVPESGKSLKLDPAEKNAIATAKLPDLLKENSVFKFAEPASKEKQVDENGNQSNADSRVVSQFSNGKETRLLPRSHGIQFNRGSNIHQIIESVIVDSLYLQNILKNIEAAKKSNDGMIDYFQVMIHTEPKGTDPTTNEEKFKFKYIVCPYRVHYSMLPEQQNTLYKADSFKSYIKRTYDYIYTGKNIDVLGFKLNFNNLYFQAAMPKQGNSDKSGTSNSATASETDEIKRQRGQAAGTQNSSVPVPPTISDAQAGSTNGRATPNKADPYYQIAYQVNQALLESVNMISGDLDIIGDPFFLSTYGMGNHLPKSKDNGITTTGESNFNTGPVVVRVNFRNPIDIDETTGLARFSELTPFSGAYRIIQCRNILRDGIFKQTLKLLRYNGQILEDDNRKPTTAIESVKLPKSVDQFVKDSAVADVKRQGVKPNEIQLSNLIKKGLPTNGLPGGLSNFLGSANATAQATFKSVSGVVGQGTNIINQVSQLGIPVGSSLAGANVLNTGIRLGSDALARLNGAALGSAALLTQAANSAKSIIPGSSDKLLVEGTSDDLTNQSASKANAFSQLGESLSQTGVALANSAKSLVTNQIENVKAIGQDAALLVGGIGDKISNLRAALQNGTAGDLKLTNLEGLTPAALAAKLGIDPSQLSGLSGMLDGKALTELDKAIGSIPRNVDLNAIKEQGIVLANLTADKIKNLPAAIQQVVAPTADRNGQTMGSSLTPDQRAAVIADATAKGIPIDSALRSAAAFGFDSASLSETAKKIMTADNPQALAGGLAQLAKSGLATVDATAGKLLAMKNQLNKLYPLGQGGSFENMLGGIQQSLGGAGSGVTQLANLDKSVTSQFGSVAASQSTPLDKLMASPVNNENDPAVPVFGGRVVRYNINELQQEVKVKAYLDARAAGKSEAEAQNISAAAGNLAGADALSKITV